MQILSHPIRLDYHVTDMRSRRMTARYLAAFRKASTSLKHYYEQINDTLSSSPMNPLFPCYTSYTDLNDSSTRTLIYNSHPIRDKLIFFAKSGDKHLCVKFVTSYSKEAHLVAAKHGFAPALYGYESLLAGWFMVIMDHIGDDHVHLDESRSKTADATY
jgi:hypothetical protein